MTPDELRAQLAELAVLSEKSKRTGEAIKAKAAKRIEEIRCKLGELKPKVLVDGDAADEYIELVEAMERMKRVLAG